MLKIEKKETSSPEANAENSKESYASHFKKKMAAIKPIHESESILPAYDFEQAGIKDVKKIAPGLVIETEDGELEIWLGDPADILMPSPIMIHRELEKKLLHHVEETGSKPPVDAGRSAYVFEDKEGVLHMFFEGQATRSVELDIDKGNDEEKWARLVLKYNIGDLFGTNFTALGQSAGEKSVPVHNLLKLETMSKLRKNLIIRKIVELEGMNPIQSCRFWAYMTAEDPPKESFDFDKAFRYAMGREMKKETIKDIFWV